MSILTHLYKQNLLARKNDIQLQLFRNNASMLNMLGTHQGRMTLPEATQSENSLAAANTMGETELMAINSELVSLDSATSGSSIDFMA